MWVWYTNPTISDALIVANLEVKVKLQALKPIVWLILFIMIVSLACGGQPADGPLRAGLL